MRQLFKSLLAILPLFVAVPAFAQFSNPISNAPPQLLLTQANTWTQPQTIAGPTLGASSTVSFLTITGTWNDAGTTFKGGLLENITCTACNVASQLFDFQVGGVDTIWGTKSGIVFATAGFRGNGGTDFIIMGTGVTLKNTSGFLFSSTTSAVNAADTGLSRDSAGVVDFGNGTIGNAAGSIKLAGITASGSAINLSGLSTSSAAQTGTVCWTTGTGNLTVDTTTTCLLSLEEFKDIRHGFPDALSITDKLKPIVFTYKKGTPQYAGDPREHYGLGARATASVDEHLAGFDTKGKIRGVRYADSVVALLVADIQAQQKEIKMLRRDLDIIKARK